MSIWPDTLHALPAPFDSGRAERLFERLAEGGVNRGNGPFHRLLAFVAGSSPYLGRSMAMDADYLGLMEREGPAAAVAAQIVEAHDARHAGSREELFKRLRIAKRRAALGIALGDVAGLLSLDEVTGALAGLADAALRSALQVMLKAEMASGRFVPVDPENPVEGSGLIVLAMGKYGALELNYSSDIDFVVFFDRERLPVAPGVEPVPFLVRVIQNVVKAMQERTGDGYVFRTDLRLRPDAGATQIAISTDAAALYYEGMGQNWERAAMIKARACAGDIPAGEAFLDELKPFVWRKYLDFAAIEDIHSIKRQIHAHKGGARVTIAGHDIKLGRGGIREIEFFAQTQQLILGGRYPVLRARRTLDALHALTEERVVSAEAERDLSAAYVYLRTLEHRLQMVADEQTHRLPEAETDRENVARFMGFADLASFEARTLDVLHTVERHYAALFESSAALATDSGSLVFTGVEDDPETLKTLTDLGFKRPENVSSSVRGWHHGRMAATRSARARELLTALMPALLQALSKTADPDAAFVRFDGFLRALPAGVQLFSMLKANERLLGILADICGAAPRMAQHLARNPAVIDAVLDTDFMSEMPERGVVDLAFTTALDEASTYEEMLDAARRVAREQNFRVGLQLLEGRLHPEDVGSAYATVAEAALLAVYTRVRRAFEDKHGLVPGGVFAIVGMGRLGAAKMTATSDLDLVFLYDHEDEAGNSDGASPLPPSVYFARLSQRLITAITAPTAEGRLYEVDMRLRPSGSKGPVAVRLASFVAYQTKEAWTWERMALTRARLIVADEAFAPRVNAAILEALTRRQEPADVRGDAASMRGRLLKDKPPRSAFDLKLASGGMIDVEFIAQAGQLVAGPDHPDVFAPSTLEALRRLKSVGWLGEEDAAALDRAYVFYSAVNHVLRLTTEDDGAAVTETGLQRLLVRAVRLGDFAELEAALAATKDDVAARFKRLVGAPVT